MEELTKSEDSSERKESEPEESVAKSKDQSDLTG